MGIGGFSPPPAFFVLLLSHAYTVLSIIYMRFILKLWWNFFYLIKEIGGSNLGLPQIFFACPDNSFKKGSPKNKLHIPKEKNKIQRLTLSTRTQRSVYWITFFLNRFLLYGFIYQWVWNKEWKQLYRIFDKKCI